MLSLGSKTKQDKKLSLYSELIVRNHICHKHKMKNSAIKFDTNHYGKPLLKNYKNFHFNISHTHNAIAVAITDSPVGIDLEKVKEVDLKIAKRFFTEREIDYIICGDNLAKRFFEVWTKKEAYIKYVGKGLSIPLKSFSVLDIAEKIVTTEKDGYIISVCANNINPNYKIFGIDENDIFQYVRMLKILG